MSNEPETSRGSRLRVAVVALVAGVTCIQLFGVTFISLPPDAAPVGTRAASQVVLHSYFEEEWKLFAPSPVSSDRNLVVQAAWRDGGTVVTGEWVDLTAIDDAIVRHSVGAPRSAYLTSRIAGNTDAAWASVSTTSRNRIIGAGTESDPLTTDALAGLLEDEDVDQSTVDYISDIDLATTTYVTDVLRVLEPGHELVAVRYGVQVSTVPPWEMRHELEKSVGDVSSYAWRTPAQDDPERRRSVAGFLERNS